MGPDYLLAGRYRLDSKLGGGGMGSVWLAGDTLLHRKVAVKQVTTTAHMDEAQAREIRRRATREGRMAARLDNPHAIAMHDVALDSGEPWLVMEYLPSRSLAKALGAIGRIPPAEVIQIGARVADALAEAHAAGIVHRDIKPGNILIADRGAALGMVKISDFGISRAAGEKEEESDVITGTPAYFAPEVARGADPDEASDVFSLGATLYTATEGQPPFGTRAETRELLYRVASGEIQPPKRSGAMTAILLRMLEPDPQRRPTMAQARDELIALQSDSRSRSSLNSPLRAADGTVPYWARRGTGSGAPSERSGQRSVGASSFVSAGPDTRRSPRRGYSPPPFEPAKRKPTIMTQPYLSMAIIAAAVLLLIVVLLLVL